MGWVNQYHDTLRDLGIEEVELGFPLTSDRGIGMLTDKYIDRMRQQLNAWCTNILQVSCHTTFCQACKPSLPAALTVDLLILACYYNVSYFLLIIYMVVIYNLRLGCKVYH